VQSSEVVEEACMMMIKLVGPANEGRMWRQQERRNLFGKPKQNLRICQFH